jgi:hypothetical protein
VKEANLLLQETGNAHKHLHAICSFIPFSSSIYRPWMLGVTMPFAYASFITILLRGLPRTLASGMAYPRSSENKIFYSLRTG